MHIWVFTCLFIYRFHLLTASRVSIITSLSKSCLLKKFKLYLFYTDYETSYTTYINHARWHRCLRSDGLHVPVWLGDHMTISPLWPGFDTRRRHVRGECVNTAPARQLVKWQSISAIQVTIKYSFFCHNSCLLVHKWRLGGHVNTHSTQPVLTSVSMSTRPFCMTWVKLFI